jgi:hypothetical protein
VRPDPLMAGVNALSKLRVMRDEQKRRALLDHLPAAIRAKVPESGLGRLQIIELVIALERHPGGLRLLLDALRALEEPSSDLAEADGALRANW